MASSSPFGNEASYRLPRVPGRETAAGRALFALYNGYGAARQRGNEFSRINRTKIRPSSTAPRPSSEPVASKPSHQKPQVKVPRFRKASQLQETKQAPKVRGKRKASEIFKQLKEDLAKMELPPYPTKPLLDDKEKQRLASLFEWSDRVENKEEFVERLNSIRSGKPYVPKSVVKGSIAEQEMLMEEIMREIEERESFLKEMEKYGSANKYKNQIQFEIQQRIQQMKKLDDLINQQVQEQFEHQQCPRSCSR